MACNGLKVDSGVLCILCVTVDAAAVIEAPASSKTGFLPAGGAVGAFYLQCIRQACKDKVGCVDGVCASDGIDRIADKGGKRICKRVAFKAVPEIKIPAKQRAHNCIHSGIHAGSNKGLHDLFRHAALCQPKLFQDGVCRPGSNRALQHAESNVKSHSKRVN